MKTNLKIIICNFFTTAWSYLKKLMVGIGVVLLITLISAGSLLWNTPVTSSEDLPEKYTIEIYNNIKKYSYTCDYYELKDNVLILRDSTGLKTRELILSNGFLTDIHLTKK